MQTNLPIREEVSAVLKVEILTVTLLKGGAMANSYCLKIKPHTLSNGQEYLFLKTDYIDPRAYRMEAEGLHELSRAQAFRVPQVIYLHKNFLVTEFIKAGELHANSWINFARNLCKLHEFKNQAYGLREDNYLGISPQKNSPVILLQDGPWARFFFEYRILPPLAMIKKREWNSQWQQLVDKAFILMEEDLPDPKSGASLLHGDLWCGNYLVDQAGEIAVVDPAIYYGHPEAELAMMNLFGGFPQEVFDYYLQQNPPSKNFARAQWWYQLYHLLNHYNLFGGGYGDQALEKWQQLAGTTS